MRPNARDSAVARASLGDARAMPTPSSDEIVRTLRMLARRAAHGELVASSELLALLDALGPPTVESVCARVLRVLAGAGDLREPSRLRRCYHAARALADRLERESPREGRLQLAQAG